MNQAVRFVELTIAVYSESHTKAINTLHMNNGVLFGVKGGGTYSNHFALNTI